MKETQFYILLVLILMLIGYMVWRDLTVWREYQEFSIADFLK